MRIEKGLLNRSLALFPLLQYYHWSLIGKKQNMKSCLCHFPHNHHLLSRFSSFNHLMPPLKLYGTIGWVVWRMCTKSRIMPNLCTDIIIWWCTLLWCAILSVTNMHAKAKGVQSESAALDFSLSLAHLPEYGQSHPHPPYCSSSIASLSTLEREKNCSLKSIIWINVMVLWCCCHGCMRSIVYFLVVWELSGICCFSNGQTDRRLMCIMNHDSSRFSIYHASFITRFAIRTSTWIGSFDCDTLPRVGSWALNHASHGGNVLKEEVMGK